jgi:hypothetical protein
MEFINAREAAKIAIAAREEIALVRASLAERCIKEVVMPCIAEEARCGRNVVVVEIALNSDAYNVRGLIILALAELGYDAKLGGNGRDFIIKW